MPLCSLTSSLPALNGIRIFIDFCWFWFSSNHQIKDWYFEHKSWNKLGMRTVYIFHIANTWLRMLITIEQINKNTNNYSLAVRLLQITKEITVYQLERSNRTSRFVSVNSNNNCHMINAYNISSSIILFIVANIFGFFKIRSILSYVLEIEKMRYQDLRKVSTYLPIIDLF